MTESDKRPQPLQDADKHNFDTLRAAADAGRLQLVSAIRKADGAAVALVCATNVEEEAGKTFVSLVPLAVMLEGNPYELFENPTE